MCGLLFAVPAGGGSTQETLAKVPDQNTYVNDDGATFTGPPVQTKPNGVGAPADVAGQANTGPFRRIYSKLGYANVRGDVFLPCRAANFAQSGGKAVESGFAYVGGWGATDYGAAVDAGFVKSTKQDGSTADNYALFIRIDRKDGYATLPREQRFGCDHTAHFVFSTTPAGVLTLVGRGYDVHGNPMSPPPLTMATVVGDGWTAAAAASSANGALVKRMTTIGQPKGWSDSTFGNTLFNPDWDKSGSYFGHAPGDDKPLIHWTSLEIGRYDPATGKVTWSRWSDGVTRAAQFFPDSSRIIVKENDADDEVVAIDLHS